MAPKKNKVTLSLSTTPEIRDLLTALAQRYPNGNISEVATSIFEQHFNENKVEVTNEAEKVEKDSILVPVETYADFHGIQPKTVVKAISEGKTDAVTYGRQRYVIVDKKDDRQFLFKIKLGEKKMDSFQEALDALTKEVEKLKKGKK